MIEEVTIDVDNPSRTAKVGKTLEKSQRDSLVALLREFTDIFAQEPKDMSGIPEMITKHSLHIKDATSSHELFSFMDAFKGYNQIKTD